MTAKHFTELVCWQLSNELKRKVYAIIARPNFARDFKFCEQIRESSRSAPRNIAEGFGKYDPPEFRRFLNMAAGSLSETQNHLRDALDLRYIDLDEFRELWRLSKRARGATVSLMNYLETCPAKGRRTHKVQNRSEEPAGRTNRENPEPKR